MSQEDLFRDSQEIPEESYEELTASQGYTIPSSQSSESDSASVDGSDSEDDGSEHSTSEPKVLVYMTLLLSLFKICREPGCGSIIDPSNREVSVSGAAVSITTTCNSNHTNVWASSPVKGTGRLAIYTINILLATYTLLTGFHISQVLEYFGHLEIHCVSRSFFFKLQNKVLHRVLWWSWCFTQAKEVNNLVEQQREGGEDENLLGDMQFDSRGFLATYGTYVMQSNTTKKIIGIWVAVKSMVSSSSAMEPFAAKSLLLHLIRDFGLRVRSLTTDRSSTMKEMLSSIAADLPTGHGEIQHFFDSWHWIKSVTRDLWTASKLKTCAGINWWFSSIRNMLWWSFGSSKGNPTELREKILSIPKHMADIHEFPENSFHKKCGHAIPLDRFNRERAFLPEDDVSLKKVTAALRGNGDCRLDDLAMTAGGTSTSMIENFNSLHNKYAPKDHFYSHEGMVSRGVLAAMDFNHNVGRGQAVTVEGVLRYDLVTHRDGQRWIIRKKKEAKDSSWRDALADLVLKAVETRQVPESRAPLGEGLKLREMKTTKPDKKEKIESYEARA